MKFLSISEVQSAASRCLCGKPLRAKEAVGAKQQYAPRRSGFQAVPGDEGAPERLKTLKTRKWFNMALALLLAGSVGAHEAAPVWAAQNKQPAKSQKVDEKQVFALAEKLGRQPELMTLEYLKYLLGRPAKLEHSTFYLTYHWQTNPGGIGTQYCTLTERRDANHQLVQAILRIDLPESDKTLVDIEKRIEGENDQAQNGVAPGGANGAPWSPNSWMPQGASLSAMPAGGSMPGVGPTGTPANGQTFPSDNTRVNGATGVNGMPAGMNGTTGGGLGALSGSLAPPYQNYDQKPHGKKLFDQECRPSLRYSFVPNTFVTYTQASHSFYVHRVEVAYSGPPLPAPNELEIESVAIAMRTRALAHHSKDMHSLAVPMLRDHLSENPADAEAHYLLGQSYQKTGNLNDAISEYQAALRYSWNNPDIAQKTAQSLQQLHVLPSPDDKFEFHDLKFKSKGQGLVEAGVNNTQDRQSMLASSTAGNYIPGGYRGLNDMPLLFSPGSRMLAPQNNVFAPSMPPGGGPPGQAGAWTVPPANSLGSTSGQPLGLGSTAAGGNSGGAVPPTAQQAANGDGDAIFNLSRFEPGF